MVGARSLPGVEDAIGNRIICHVDHDCFYAACERLRDPTLVGKPVIVGMGFEPGDDHGAVATASYEAREYGVESAQPISAAIETLPPADQVPDAYDGPVGYYRPVDMPYYRSRATEVRNILADCADTMREVSIDEAYLECTERTTWTEAEAFARSIKARIADEVGLPVSVGVAPAMSVAKVASDYDKPDGLVVIPPERVEGFLDPLPVEKLHGIGPVTAEHLHSHGIERVGELADTDPELLIEQFGERGRELHRRASGIDHRSVTPRGNPKSLSRESAFDEPVSDQSLITERIRELGYAVAERATARGATYRTIGIKVVRPPFDVSTRERSLAGPVDDANLVVDIATDLLTEFSETTIRKVGVRVSNLSFAEGDQTRLGSWKADDASETAGGDRPRHHRGQGRLSDFG